MDDTATATLLAEVDAAFAAYCDATDRLLESAQALRACCDAAEEELATARSFLD